MAKKDTTTVKVKTYVWQGVDKRGAKVKGEIVGENQALIKAQLRKQGINPKSVKRKPEALFGSGNKPIKPADIAIFTRQMATMVKAGVPLIQSFDIVAEGSDNRSVTDLIMTIKNEVAGGTTFENALKSHPRYFDDLYCSLVGAGEQAGALESMLDRVATYKEKTEELKKKIKKALTYPVLVMGVAFIVTGILLIFVVPSFAETFESFGSELPAFTQVVVDLSEWMQAYWWMVLGTGFGIFYFIKEMRIRSKRFSDGYDAAMLKAPIVGELTYMSIIARFSRTLATTFAAGVPLVEALNSVAGAAGNAVFTKAVFQIRDDVTTGQQLASSVRMTGIFPNLLLQMVSIGEESGALDEMLDKVADHYESEVDNAVDNLTSMLEPLIMSVLGVLIGGLMVAMYLPMFMIGDAIG